MIMVGVSTRQNITNLIPAVQKSNAITSYVLLESETAKKQSWSKGLIAVLERRNISVEVLRLPGLGTQVQEISSVLNEKFKQVKEPITWNLGGGQKPQQIPIWELFKSRNQEQHIPDTICYANQDNKGLLEVWEYENGQVKQRNESIQVDLSAIEIFEVFGLQVQKGYELIYSNGQSKKRDNIPDLLEYPEFRELFIRLPVEQNDSEEIPITVSAINQLLNNEKETLAKILAENITYLCRKARNNDKFIEGFIKKTAYAEKIVSETLKQTDSNEKILSLLKQHFNTKWIDTDREIFVNKLNSKCITFNENTLLALTDNQHKDSSSYFKDVVIQRVLKLLDEKKHSIVNAYAKLEISKDEATLATYDVLCVTDKGTILALDVRLNSFGKKEMDHLLFTLEQGAGYYRTYSAVLPVNYDDIGKDWFKNTASIPFFLANKNFPFFVISDSALPKFWIKKDGRKIFKKTKQPSEVGWIECKHLDAFIS